MYIDRHDGSVHTHMYIYIYVVNLLLLAFSIVCLATAHCRLEKSAVSWLQKGH